jgi:hypothetical protein
MNHKSTLLGLFFVLCMLSSSIAAPKPVDNIDLPSGSVAFRFSVPEKQVTEIWQYVRNLDVKQLSDDLNLPPLTHTKSVISKSDQYYDDSRLTFLDNGYSLYSQKRILGLKKNGKPRIRETVVGDVPSAEVTFVQLPVRHYRIVASPEEKHPLLGLVKRSERVAFIDFLEGLGIKNPFELRKTIVIKRENESLALFAEGQPLAVVNLDKVVAMKYGFEQVYYEVSLVWSGVSAFSAGQGFAKISDYLQSELPSRFPAVELETRNHYQKGVVLLSKKVPFFRSTLKVPQIFKGIQAILIILFGFMLYAVFFRKRVFTD